MTNADRDDMAFTLIHEMPPPFDEGGRYGTCTAQAVAGCYAHLHHKRYGEWLTLSRLHLFYEGRKRLYGSALCDHMDCWLGSVMQALGENGACREEVWPFNIDNHCRLPRAVETAPKYRLQQYWNISGPAYLQNPGRNRDAQQALEDRIIRSLESGYPVVFVIDLNRNFAPEGPDDVIPMPAGPRWMWHAMLLYGYDRGIGMYKVQNSWGAGWGYQGKCRIPMQWINRDGRDFYAMRAPE